MIIEGIICHCCFEDEQRILNSELESLLPLGTEAVCLTLSNFVIYADKCWCRVFDHVCGAVWETPVIWNTELLPLNLVNLSLALPAVSFLRAH